MNQSLLLQLLQTFTPVENRLFRKWLKSPITDTRAEEAWFFTYISQQLKKKNPRLDKIKAFKHLHPDVAFSDDRMRYEMTCLLKAAKAFLAFQEWQSDPFVESIYLCSSLRKRGLDALFEREARRLEQQLEEHPTRNRQYYYLKWQLRSEEYQLAYRKKQRTNLALHEQEQALHTYLLAEIMRFGVIAATQQKVQANVSAFPLLTAALRIIQEQQLQTTPSIGIYYYSYLVQLPEAPQQYFEQLQLLLHTFIDHFPSEEARDIYLLTINYCIRQVNRGKEPFIRKALTLYQHGIEQQILFENGVLSRYTYNNALMLALALREYEEARLFLDKYKSYLHESHRENAYNYNKAIWHFRRQQYEEAMQLLQQVAFTDVFYALNARSMLARIYYETEAMDALDSLLDSFSIYLRRQSNLGYHRQLYANFIRLLRKMSTMDWSRSENRQKLKAEIQSVSEVAEREWLLEKIEPEN